MSPHRRRGRSRVAVLLLAVVYPIDFALAVGLGGQDFVAARLGTE